MGSIIADQIRCFIRFDPFSVRDRTEQISALDLYDWMKIGCYRSSCAHQKAAMTTRVLSTVVFRIYGPPIIAADFWSIEKGVSSLERCRVEEMFGEDLQPNGS
jgi:hypothetical protein